MKTRNITTISLILSILSAVSILICVFFFRENAIAPWLILLGILLSVSVCVLMLIYCRKEEKAGDLRLLLGLFIAHAALVALTQLIGQSAFAVVLHALADAALAAFLTEMIFAANRKRCIWAVIAAAVIFAVLGYLGKSLPLGIAFAVLAALCFAFSLVGYKNDSDLSFWGMLASLDVLLYSVISIIMKHAANLHLYMHITVIVTACCAIAACLFVDEDFEEAAPDKALDANAEENETEDEEEVETLVLEQNESAEVPADRSLTEEKAEETAEAKSVQETSANDDAAPSAAAPVIDSPFNKWIIKKYQGLSAKELLDAPVDALKGLSANDAVLLKDAFNIKTIGDLARNKFFAWAEEIVEESVKE